VEQISDGSYIVNYFNVLVDFLHLLAMAVWIGGMAVMNFVVTPSMKNAPPEAGPVQGQIMGRFSAFAWTSVAILIITGILKIIRMGTGIFQTFPGHVIEFKVTIALVMIIIGFIVGRILVPRLGRLLQSDGPPPMDELQSIQGRIQSLAKINFYLGVIILAAVALI